MGATSHQVARNFAYHIAKATPTAVGREWRQNKRPFVLAADLSPGSERSFTVRPLRSGALDTVTDGYSRISDWRFEVEVAFTENRDLESLNDIMCQDAADLVGLLRMADTFIGYSADQQTADIGLLDRELESQVFDMVSETTAYLRQQWRVKIEETQ